MTSADALVRPWRTATIVASLIAAVELVVLVGGAVFLLAKPLSHAVRNHAAAAARASASAKTKTARPAAARASVPVVKPAPVGKAKLSRTSTGVLVLNGNGRTGAAATAASRLSSLGYRVRATGNAPRQDYATTVVMYRSGYRAEGARLARDLHVKVFGGLEGLSASKLHGAQLAIILGAG
jgi:hypothetical protein